MYPKNQNRKLETRAFRSVFGGMRFLAKNYFSEITFSMLTPMDFNSAISRKLFFGEFFDQKGTFLAFLY
jgi:hypothetical protein